MANTMNIALKRVLPPLFLLPAITYGQEWHVFEGRYVGFQGSLGLPQPTVETEVDYQLAEEDLQDDGRISFSDTDLDVRGQVFVGTGLQDGPLYLGLEGYYILGNTMDDDELSSSSGRAYVKIDETFGVSARLGGVLWEGNNMLYLRLGYAQSEAELSAGDSSESTDLDGLHYGVGIEYGSFDLPILMRLEGSVKAYGSEDFFQDAELNHSELAIDLGVGYRFR